MLLHFGHELFYVQLLRFFKHIYHGDKMNGSQKQDKNELLYQCFNINYKKSIPQIFRQGTCALRTLVEVSVKYKDDGSSVKRTKRKVTTVHMENIASRRFWNDQLYLLKELGQFTEDINKTKTEYLKSFQYESRLMLSTWVVICIDGCHFHSFVLKKESLLYGRHASDSFCNCILLFFNYAMKWKEFFPQKEMKHLPYFDGRAVCYPFSEILRDYLAWRQVDCHINNQYNTCFWMLVKFGKSKTDAQNCLKGTQVQEKNELLAQLSDITNYYNTLPPIFRHGSSIYWDKLIYRRK